MTMRPILYLLLQILVTALGSNNAHAVTIYTQSLDLNAAGGPFSTSPNFNGNNNPHHQIADQFSLGHNAALTDLV